MYIYTHIVYTHTYTREDCPAIKKNEILSFVTTWVNLEGITLCEISQTQKRLIPYDFSDIWNLKKKAHEQTRKQIKI